MRLLGIDYGRRRIGLALSDATGLLARPWKTIQARATPRAVADDLARLVCELRDEEDGLAAVVLGWPKRLSGEPNDQTALVEALATRLQEETGVPVTLQDERLSSREAESALAKHEKDWRKRKASLDAMAATIILQDHLDARTRAGADSPVHAHPDPQIP